MRAVVFLVLATLFWAGNFVFGAAALDTRRPDQPHLDPVGCSPSSRSRSSRSWSRSRTGARRCATCRCSALLGVLGITGFSLLLYFALQFTSPLNASLINAVNPALIVILAAVLPGVAAGRPPRADQLAVGARHRASA